MIGKITEKELSPNFKEKINSLESELSSQSPKTLSLNHGVNIVESKNSTLINLPYIKGRTVVNHAPLFDSGLWTIHSSSFVEDGGTKLKVTTTGNQSNPSVCEINLRVGEIYTLLNNGDARLYVRQLGSENNILSSHLSMNGNPITFQINEYAVKFTILADVTTAFEPGDYYVINPLLVKGTEPKEFVRGFQPIRNPMLVNDDNNSHMSFPNVTLASNEDGTIYDELLPSGEVVKRFDHAVIDGNFDGFINVTALRNSDGIKAIRFNEWILRNNGVLSGVNGEPYGYIMKYDGSIVRWGSSILADHFNFGNSGGADGYRGNIFLGVSSQDSGWGDNYTPTVDEIKAYFNGWKMTYFESGVSWNRYRPYNGVGNKLWFKITRLSDSIPIEGNSPDVVTVNPPTDPAGIDSQGKTYTPYKLQYQLAQPRIKKVNPIGRIQFQEGNNHIEVGEGIILREKANPEYSPALGNYYINSGHELDRWVSTRLKNRAEHIMNLYENGVLVDYWVRETETAYGKERIMIPNNYFNATATYYVDYIAMPYVFTAQVKEAEASYPVSIASKVDQHGELIIKNEKRIEEVCNKLFTSVSNGKELVASAITGKGVPTEATNTFQQMADNISDISTVGARVQRGFRILTSSNTLDNVTISNVDMNRSIVKISIRTLNTSTAARDILVRANLTSGTNLQLQRGNLTEYPPIVTVYYEVIEFTGLKSVQHGIFSYSENVTSISIPISRITATKATHFVSYLDNWVNADNKLIATYLHSASLEVFATVVMNNLSISWYVIEFE